MAKRLELLKEMIPSLRRVATFYNPDNPISQAAANIARDAARELKVELIERPVHSVGELRSILDALRPGDADALPYMASTITKMAVWRPSTCSASFWVRVPQSWRSNK